MANRNRCVIITNGAVSGGIPRRSGYSLVLLMNWGNGRGLDVAADDAAFGVADELDDFVALAGRGELGLDAVDCVGDVQARQVEVTVDFLDVADLVVGKVTAAQADGVDAGVGDGVTACLDEGGDVLVDARATLEHDVGADVAELVDQRAAADDGEVVNLDLAGDLRGVRHDDVVADLAVVGDVGVCHDQAVAADDGVPLRGCAAVDGDALADGRVVADDGDRLLTLEFQILGDA